ncbi:MAG TPA: BamA/TamA family outer membrane protein [Williamwhitmania sp.]|nr:BamA/TamA family outer membrane protein [Williamwhitmania sp.]
MQKTSKLLMLIALLAISWNAEAQVADSTVGRIKTGWTFGALPVIAYDSDLGLEYGGLVNFYYYGDGTTYPVYRQSIYAEVSRYTKGSGINRLFYDSKYLIPGVRVTADMSYLTDKAADFYGFNGYEAAYNQAWTDDAAGNLDYKTRVFYKYDRKIERFSSDFQGKLSGKRWLWAAGISLYNFKTGPVNVDELNKGKSEANKLPNVTGLYDKYVDWGIIGPNEKNGGFNSYIRLGTVFDSRDNEANPNTGMWSEAILSIAPPLLGNDHYEHLNISLVHRQYIPIIKGRLTFAYRLAAQLKLAGSIPFYLKPNLATLYLRRATSEGLGGSQTLRGILRNRVVGDGVAYGNFELRWKFINTVVWKQNLYLALSAFTDMGRVVQKVKFDKDKAIAIAQAEDPTFKPGDYFPDVSERLHASYGGGLHIALNENFILAIDYGKAVSKKDGDQGLYIALNFLF